MGQKIKDVARDTASFFTGGTSGVATARGSGPTRNTIATDAAGLAAGAGLASAGLGTAASGTMPPAILDTGGASMMPVALNPAGGPAGLAPVATFTPSLSTAASVPGTANALKTAATILAPVTSAGAAVATAKAAKTATDIRLQAPNATPMPVGGGPNTIAAQRGAIAEQLRRRGRASTIMTAPVAETLG